MRILYTYGNQVYSGKNYFWVFHKKDSKGTPFSYTLTLFIFTKKWTMCKTIFIISRSNILKEYITNIEDRGGFRFFLGVEGSQSPENRREIYRVAVRFLNIGL